MYLKLTIDDTESHLVFLKCFLESAHAADLLHAEYVRQIRLKFSARRVPVIDAIWLGYWELKTQAHKHIREVQRRGQLLFAHTGTSLVTQEAA